MVYCGQGYHIVYWILEIMLCKYPGCKKRKKTNGKNIKCWDELQMCVVHAKIIHPEWYPKNILAMRRPYTKKSVIYNE